MNDVARSSKAGSACSEEEEEEEKAEVPRELGAQRALAPADPLQVQEREVRGGGAAAWRRVEPGRGRQADCSDLR